MMKRTITQVLLLILAFTQITLGQTGVPRIVVNAQGHAAKVENLLFTPSGQQLISISDDKTARIWNVANSELLKKFESQIGDGPEGMFYASALSPDGKLLAISGYPVSTEKENYIILIDMDKGVQIGTAIGHTNVINSLDFSGDGGLLVSGSDDGTIKIWKAGHTQSLPLLSTITAGGAVKSLTVNPRNQDVAVVVEGEDRYSRL